MTLVTISLRATLWRYGTALASRGVESVAKFGLYALAAHLLGAAQSGVFFLCLTLLHLTSTAARLGLDRPISRHVSAELAVGRPDLAGRAMAQGLAVCAASGCALGLGLIVAAPYLAQHAFNQPGIAAALMLTGASLPLHVVTYAACSALIGLDRAAAAQFISNAIAPLAVLVGLVVGVSKLDQVLILYGVAYGCCAIAALTLVVIHRARAKKETVACESAHAALPSLLSSAGAFFVIDLVQAGLLAAPTLALGVFTSSVAVSQFSIANRLTMLIATIVLAVATMAAPRFAAHWRRAEFDELKRVRRGVDLICAASCLPLVALMVVFRSPLLAFMGTGGQAAVTALIIMALGQVVVALLPARDTLLAMSGHGAIHRRLSLLQALVCGAGCLVLIPTFGVVGAAIASTLTWLLGVIGCEILVRRALPQLYA